jgi:hypothetical protein
VGKLGPKLAKLIQAGARNALFDHGIYPASAHNKQRSLDETIRFESACTQAAFNRGRTFSRPYEANFRAFSQFNEDGILQYLTQVVPCPNQTFVEIGTEDYTESNTRFLLEKDWWSGVTIDAGNEAEEWMRRTGIAFVHDIRHIRSFVTRTNIESLLAQSFADIDVLSIDVDGVDYYLWDAVRAIRPRIVMIEFNPIFGPDKKIVIPYRDDFSRRAHHSTMTCYGASLSALLELACGKDYSLVETSNGPNAFFVANEHLGSLRPLSVQEAWRNWNIKESFNPDGTNDLVFDRQERLRRISDAVIIDLEHNQETTVSKLLL